MHFRTAFALQRGKADGQHITDTSGRITRYEYAANDPARLIKIYSPEYDAEHPQYVTTLAVLFF